MGKWTRRAFIGAGAIGTGALVVGIAIRPGNRVDKVADLIEGPNESAINLWVKIGSDNKVTVIAPHSEMGQGAQTALAMMLADELDADWSLVEFVEAPAHKEYANYHLARGFILGDASIPKILLESVDGVFRKVTQSMGLQVTGGSASIRFTGEEAMRVAGAAAKSMLLGAAAKAWNTDVSTLTASNSFIEGPGGKRAPYSEFAAAAADQPMPKHPVLKSVEQFNIIGVSTPRFDLPAKVDGSAMFGLDVEVPGMKYAAISASPVFGGVLKSYDRDAVSQSPGVVDVVALPNAIAVVANGYWQAAQALKLARPVFDAGDLETVTSELLFEQFKKSLDQDKRKRVYASDIAKPTISDAVEVIESEYTVPFLAHATMEPMNCTAHYYKGKCEIWTGSQNPLGFAQDVADALDIDHESVTFHNYFMGGGFGRRAIGDYAIQAALISKAVQVPVKLIWSREEDTQQDHYRPAAVSRLKAGLDQQGKPIAWQNQFVFQHDPKDASLIPYAIANQLIEFTEPQMHIRFGPWRSVDHSQHGFFIESFIDELANATQQDPYQYRRELLKGQPRYQAVLDKAAQAANWGASLPPHHGRGIAIRKSFGTIVAQVAEVAIENGNIVVKRVVCAADAGIAVNPDSFVAQMESGIIFGMTAALYGDIHIKAGGIVQSNFHDYKMVRMNNAPMIETHIINGGGQTGGAGEPGTPPIAPAIANAVFAATGERLRNLPLSGHRFDLS